MFLPYILLSKEIKWQQPFIPDRSYRYVPSLVALLILCCQPNGFLSLIQTAEPLLQSPYVVLSSNTCL